MSSIEIPYKDEFGRQKIYTTSRPPDTITYFCGKGDDLSDPENPVIGEGSKLQFNMTTSDESKSVFMEFSEDVWIKDGYIITRNAPFGASLCVYIYHPLYGRVGSFCKNVPVLGDGWFPLDTDDRSKLVTGLKLEIELHNSSGANGEDAPANFVLAGRIELFRKTTI